MNLEKVFKACGFNKIDEKLATDINKIIEWQQVLKQIDVTNVEPMFNTLGAEQKYIYNEDVVMQDNTNILTNAPEQEDNFFLVPKVIKN